MSRAVLQAAPVDLTDFRAMFPLLDRVTYLNTCVLGPLPRSGAAALHEFTRSWDEQGASAWPTTWSPRVALLRERIARLIGAPAGTVALAPELPTALADVVSATLRLTSRRTILIGEPDAPVLGRQFLSRPDLTVEFVPAGDGVTVTPADFAARMDERTAVVATSHVLHRSGAIQDVGAIAAAARLVGAFSVVDGSHAVGCLPVDVGSLGADVYVGGCLKWLSGGPGTAFAYYAPELLSELPPIDTSCVPSYFAALAGLDVVLDAGIDAICARLRRFTGMIIDRCADAGLEISTPTEPDRRCGIVTIACPQADQVVGRLAADGVVADARHGQLRLSPHWALADADVERGMDRVIDAILPPGPGAQPWPRYRPPLDRLAECGSTAPEIVRYGAEPDQFAQLWCPPTGDWSPVVVLLHGGYWRRRYRLDLMNGLARNLVSRGIAAFNVEYRRMAGGGGWPATGADLVAAMAALSDAALDHRLDLDRMVVLGHSVGGQLGLWLASVMTGRRPKLVVALGGVCDLVDAGVRELGEGAVHRFFDSPDAVRACSPAELVPLGVPQLLVHGTADERVPAALSENYHRAAVAAGDDCELIIIPSAGHLDLVDPNGRAWRSVSARLDDLF